MPAILVGHSLGNMIIERFFAWMAATYPQTHLAWAAKNTVAFYALGPPLMGAVSAARSVTTGDNMGLPISEVQVGQ